MATRLVRTEFDGRLGARPVTDDRRPAVVNGRSGYFTPAEIEEEQERRRLHADHDPMPDDGWDEDDYRD